MQWQGSTIYQKLPIQTGQRPVYPIFMEELYLTMYIKLGGAFTAFPSESRYRFLCQESTMVQNYRESRRQYWATHLSICFHRSLIHSLIIARFAYMLRCAHLFAGSLLHSLPSSWERESLDAGTSGCSEPQRRIGNLCQDGKFLIKFGFISWD